MRIKSHVQIGDLVVAKLGESETVGLVTKETILPKAEYDEHNAQVFSVRFSVEPNQEYTWVASYTLAKDLKDLCYMPHESKFQPYIQGLQRKEKSFWKGQL